MLKPVDFICFPNCSLPVLTLREPLSLRQIETDTPVLSYKGCTFCFQDQGLLRAVSYIGICPDFIVLTQDCQLTCQKLPICLLFLLVGTSPEAIWDKFLILTFSPSLSFLMVLCPEENHHNFRFIFQLSLLWENNDPYLLKTATARSMISWPSGHMEMFMCLSLENVNVLPDCFAKNCLKKDFKKWKQ